MDITDLLRRSNVTGSTTKAVCIGVKNLRQMGYSDLQQWCQQSNHVLTTRRGRLFIHDPLTKTKREYMYPQSKWHNPFNQSNEQQQSDILRKYLIYLTSPNETGGRLVDDIEQLRGKTLGCFCTGRPCHAHLLADILNRGLDHVLQQYKLNQSRNWIAWRKFYFTVYWSHFENNTI